MTHFAASIVAAGNRPRRRHFRPGYVTATLDGKPASRLLPGFTAYIPGYEGYSADFFDGKHYVLKGGSWATADALVRPSFRNWFQAHYPYVFAKFRCVADATSAARSGRGSVGIGETSWTVR